MEKPKPDCYNLTIVVIRLFYGGQGNREKGLTMKNLSIKIDGKDMELQDLAAEIRSELIRLETIRNKIYKSRNSKAKFKREALESVNDMLASGLILYDNLFNQLINKKG